MDSIPLLALAVIAAVPAVFIGARVFLYPITGLCLWVLLLPVTKTVATLGETGPESLIELATYSWLCLALVVICQLLSSPDRVRRVLTAWRRAGVIGCVAGGVGTLLLWRGSMDNLLVQGGRVAGLFEGINQLQSFVIAVIPFFCARLFSRAASRGTRILYGPLVGVGPGGFAAWVPRVVPGGKAQEMHNSYLGVLGETGAIGGLIMLALLADAMARTLRFLLWAVRARDPDALMAARALFVSYASILMYGMLNYGLRQRHFWFVVALTVAVPHVYGQWRARARVAP